MFGWGRASKIKNVRMSGYRSSCDFQLGAGFSHVSRFSAKST
jgi:hypothetical protein